MKYNLVCFDMDGVILDSMPQLMDLAIDTIAHEYGLEPEAARIGYQRTVGMPFRKQLETLFPDHRQNERVSRGYEGIHRLDAPTFPLSVHAQMVMDILRPNCSIALVTSTHRRILMNALPQVRLLGFDYLGGFMDGHDKARQIESAMAATSNLPEQTILFGDSELDGFYAAKAGVSFRMLTHENLNLAIQFAQGGK